MKIPERQIFLLRIRSAFAPGLIFLFIMAVTIVLRTVSLAQIERDLEEAGEEECRRVVGLLESSIKAHMTAIEGVANHLTHSSKLTPANFAGYCRQIMGGTEGFLVIAATGPDLRPLWLESDSPITAAEFRSVVNADSIQSTLRKLRSNAVLTISDPLESENYGEVFASVIPYYQGPLQAGYVVGLFPADVIKTLHKPELLNFSITVQQAGDLTAPRRMLLETAARAESADTARFQAGVRDSIFLGSQKWEVQVYTSGYRGTNPFWFTSGAILFLGTGLALVLGSFLYRQQILASTSRYEARDSQTRLASTSDRLATITEELDLILNNVDEGIILYDEKLNPLQTNDAFVAAFGGEADFGAAQDSADKHHYKMSSLFQLESQYWALFNTLRENPEEPAQDEIQTRSEGDNSAPLFYERRATAVCGPDGDRRGYLVIYQDQTPKRTVERLKDDFLSSVTHDLRTPLAAIKGFAETMLRDKSMENNTRDEFMSIICSESSRLQEMIEDLLDLRRMEEGRMEFAPSSYDIQLLVEGVVRSSQPILSTRALKVEMTWEGAHTIALLGDVSKISRALRNVLSNSIKYSPTHGTIHIIGRESNDRVEIEFRDDGPGIPENELAHVFEKFYRGAKHVRRTQGTGLGLSIVKHIVEGHGGVVSAANLDSGGTVVRIVLPRDFDHGLANVQNMDEFPTSTPARAAVLDSVGVPTKEGAAETPS